MQRGSLVILKDNPLILGFLVQRALWGMKIPRPGVVYTLSSDPFEHFCQECNENHIMITLEEIPHKWDPEIFDEVQAPGEVNVENLISEPVLTPA